MKPYRHSREMMERYLKEGYWGRPGIADLWERNAQSCPDREAIADSRTRMTWAQANLWIDRVALGLLELGLKKDEVLVSQLPNMLESMLLRYALERAGILGLPAMMTLRRREMEQALKHTDATGVVIMPEYGGFDYLGMIREMRPQLPKLRYIIVPGEGPEGAVSLAQMSRQPLEEKYPPGHLQGTSFGDCEVICLKMTSGTTGFPKFVERPNNLSIAGPVNVERWKMTDKDVCAALAPIIGGAASILCCYTAPYVAARVVLLEKFDPEEALKVLERERVTIAGGVPAQMAMMLRHPNFHRYDLGSLRAFYYAGSVCPYSLAEELETKMGCRIINDLGSVDGGNVSSTSVDDPPVIRRTSVGKIYPGTEVKLLDGDGNDVSPGETGEIVVRGAIATSGYFRDPETTRQIWGEEPDGWFHTGDLGKFDAEGNLYVVGRAKDLIIRGGQNIVPGEIENLLITHPKVLNVAVVAMPDPVMGERVCACVIPKTGQHFTFEEMIAHLRSKETAPFKLPERLEVMESFPMSGDGQKIMKKQLSEEIAEKIKAETQGKRPAVQ